MNYFVILCTFGTMEWMAHHHIISHPCELHVCKLRAESATFGCFPSFGSPGPHCHSTICQSSSEMPLWMVAATNDYASNDLFALQSVFLRCFVWVHNYLLVCYSVHGPGKSVQPVMCRNLKPHSAGNFTQIPFVELLRGYGDFHVR